MNYEVIDFSSDVIQASYDKPVLVDFWAEWCGPCRILGPVLERLASQNNGAWKLVKVNSDEYQDISAEYGIRSIPNVKLFYKGEVINEFVGALPESQIVDWLKKNIPNKFRGMISQAEGFLSAGNEEDAKQILGDILKSDGQNSDARVLLSRIILFDDPNESLDLISNIEVTSDKSEQIEAVKTLADLLTGIEKFRLDYSPTKHLFLNAVNDLREKKFETCLEKLIEIIRTDRYYSNDISRHISIAIFKFLGEENEITLKCRRDFGRALYV